VSASKSGTVRTGIGDRDSLHAEAEVIAGAAGSDNVSTVGEPAEGIMSAGIGGSGRNGGCAQSKRGPGG
jgi:hypothetical protein